MFDITPLIFREIRSRLLYAVATLFNFQESLLDEWIYFSLKRIGKNATYGFKFRRRALNHFDIQLQMEFSMNKIMRFFQDESGATAIEYGLLASLIAIVIIVGVTAVGTKLNAKFLNIATNLK